MNKGLWIALALSVLANILLFYRIVDLGVTMTYGADELTRREGQLSTMQVLLPHLVNTATHATIQKAAQKAGLEILDKGAEGLYVGEVHFIFTGDTLTSVKVD